MNRVWVLEGVIFFLWAHSFMSRIQNRIVLSLFCCGGFFRHEGGVVFCVLLQFFGHFLIYLVFYFCGVASFTCIVALPWSFSNLLIGILQLLYLILLFIISGIILCSPFIFIFICTLLTSPLQP